LKTANFQRFKGFFVPRQRGSNRLPTIKFNLLNPAIPRLPLTTGPAARTPLNAASRGRKLMRIVVGRHAGMEQPEPGAIR
jgi:hypothetical protein